MFRLEDMKKYIILSLLCGCLSVNAQTMVPLTYRQYMERVAEGNLEYASEKLNVPAAKAEVTAAKVFNDPNLSVSYFNNENNSLQMGEGVEVELRGFLHVLFISVYFFDRRNPDIDPCPILGKADQILKDQLVVCPHIFFM